MGRRWTQLWRLAGDLRHGHRSELTGVLHHQIDTAAEGARLCVKLVSGDLEPAQAREQMGDIEHAGDEVRGELVERLSGALVTPIDREDLFRVSRSVDDVLDNLRDFVREWHLFEPPTREEYRGVLEPLLDALDQLAAGVSSLEGRAEDAATGCLAAKKQVNAVRQGYQTTLGVLYGEPLSIDTLKHRDLLRRLDVAGLRLGEAADALTDGALKRVT